MADRQTGTVKWFSDEKGFGFITPDAGTNDLFVRYKAIEGVGYNGLNEGQRVSFVAVQGPKGTEADQVRAE
ncbi:cold-shock protein [Streptomyces sp. NPDC091268]|uniref:cold-shock protein n=1 Tax=Streptomyces sp. NPDC091268 TaxID=3365979 RepID=UPI0037FDC5D4